MAALGQGAAELELEEQVGGQLKAGLVLTHLFEDYNGYGKLHEMHVPTFVATRAIKPK